MDDNRLDQIMEQWIDHEASNAPSLYPKKEMYRKIAGLRKHAPFHAGLLFAWGGTAALIFLAVFFMARSLRWLPLDRLSPQIGIHRIEVSEKREGRGEPKGGKKGPSPETMALVQYLIEGRRPVENFILKAGEVNGIALTSRDRYRVLVRCPEDRVVYIYQASGKEHLVRLFPDPLHHPEKNPLPKGRLLIVPQEPDWFFLIGNGKSEELFIILSEEKKPAWEERYAQYLSSRNKSRRRALLEWFFSEFSARRSRLEEKTLVYHLIVSGNN